VRIRSPAMARAVWPAFPGQRRPLRTTIEAGLSMLEIVGVPTNRLTNGRPPATFGRDL